MNAARTEQPAVKGEKRYIMVGSGKWELCECIMVLGMAFDPTSGKMHREAMWGRENGRRIHSSAHENWK